jgi:hypothetical protein
MEFTEQELKAMRAEYGKGASDSQWELFISECRARNLRPGSHLVFQLRSAKEYDPTVGASVFVKKGYWITTVAALLLIAERTGKFDGASAPEYIYLDDEGDPTVISDIPLPDKNNRTAPREPWAVRVKVRRKDFSEPIVSTVRFDSVAATMKRGESIVLTDMWVKRGPEQNAKCSLANGIRLTFPEDAGHLYLTEEIRNEVEETPASSTPAPVVNVPAPPVVPAVNQTPAMPTNTPRPSDEPTVTVTLATTAPPTSDMVRRVAAEDAIIQATAKVVDKVNSGEYAPANDAPLTEEVAKEAAKLVDPPKPARKPRAKKESPVNGPEAITQADVEEALKPTPDTTARDAELRQQAAAAVEEATSFTVEEAVAQGLSAPDDPIPSKEEMKEITQWIRKIAATGIGNQDLKEYFLRSARKTDPKFLTKKEWAKAFEEFHKAELEGRAKEFVKEGK